MKSIIKTNTKKMLLSVNNTDDINQRLCRVAEAHGVRFKAVGSECGNEQLGYLLGFDEFLASGDGKREITQSCVVFSGIASAELDLMLKALREAQAVIPLKAVCTPYNQGWRLGDLVTELAKEHELMNGGKGSE